MKHAVEIHSTPEQVKSLRWRVGLGLLLALCTLLAVNWFVGQHAHASLLPQQVDRLRMQALAGQEAQALPALKQAAKQNNILAQRALAEIFLRHYETAQEGVHYAESAAKNGDALSQLMLGKAYFSGMAASTRVPDMPRAQHWLELAAEKKNANAMYLLGLMHKNSYLGQPDLSLSVKWLARAVQLGDPDAMFMLGNAYHEGEGVQKDEAQALRLYQAAAEKEHPLATQTLALAYQNGELGLQQDKKTAAKMMLEVAHILSHPDPH